MQFSETNKSNVADLQHSEPSDTLTGLSLELPYWHACQEGTNIVLLYLYLKKLFSSTGYGSPRCWVYLCNFYCTFVFVLVCIMILCIGKIVSTASGAPVVAVF